MTSEDLPIGFIIYVVGMVVALTFLRGCAIVNNQEDEYEQTELFNQEKEL